MTTVSPFVGLPADTYENHGFLFHSLGDKYVRAVAEVSKCTPLMIPSIIDAVHLDDLLESFRRNSHDRGCVQCASAPLWRGTHRRS